MKNDFIKNKNKSIPKKAKKLSLGQIITLCLMVFWTISSILTIALTISNCSSSKDNNVAYAEEIVSGDIVYNNYDFYGNDLFYMSAYRNVNSAYWDKVDFIKFGVNTSSSYDVNTSRYITHVYVNSNTYNNTNNDEYLNVVPLTAYINGSSTGLLENVNFVNGTHSVFDLRTSADSQYNYPLLVNVVGNYNSNVIFIEIGSTTSVSQIYPSEPNLPKPNNTISTLRPYNVYTYVKYIDNNNNYIVFSFPSSNNMTLNNRIYSINNYEDSDIYDLGYSDGQYYGEQIGYNNGYDKGYEYGKSIGFALGEQEGINKANDYSFFNLISSVIDAPIQAFKGLLNFEILGYNMSNLLLSLFTLSIIIVVIKIFI